MSSHICTSPRIPLRLVAQTVSNLQQTADTFVTLVLKQCYIPASAEHLAKFFSLHRNCSTRYVVTHRSDQRGPPGGDDVRLVGAWTWACGLCFCPAHTYRRWMCMFYLYDKFNLRNHKTLKSLGVVTFVNQTCSNYNIVPDSLLQQRKSYPLSVMETD